METVFRIAVRSTDLDSQGHVKVRQRSFALTYEIRCEADDALVVEGESVQVWLDEGGRAAPLPDAVRRGLEGSLGG